MARATTMKAVNDAPLRVGGMAFGNGVFMRSQRHWALARADGSVVDGPVGSLLNRHRWLRLPLLRSAIALFEMGALMIRLHRRIGVRPAASLLAWLGLAMVISLCLDVILPALIPSALLAGAVPGAQLRPCSARPAPRSGRERVALPRRRAQGGERLRSRRRPRRPRGRHEAQPHSRPLRHEPRRTYRRPADSPATCRSAAAPWPTSWAASTPWSSSSSPLSSCA